MYHSVFINILLKKRYLPQSRPLLPSSVIPSGRATLTLNATFKAPPASMPRASFPEFRLTKSTFPPPSRFEDSQRLRTFPTRTKKSANHSTGSHGMFKALPASMPRASSPEFRLTKSTLPSASPSFHRADKRRVCGALRRLSWNL